MYEQVVAGRVRVTSVNSSRLQYSRRRLNRIAPRLQFIEAQRLYLQPVESENARQEHHRGQGQERSQRPFVVVDGLQPPMPPPEGFSVIDSTDCACMVCASQY